MEEAISRDHAAEAVDFRGSRRLTGAGELLWYLVAAVSYILLGVWHKWLLNWFVGPLWLVTIIVVGPWLTDRLGLTGRRRPTSHEEVAGP